MSRLMIAMFIAAGVCIAGTGSAQTYAARNTMASAPMTKDGYAMAKKDADAQYTLDKAALVHGEADAKVDRVALDTRNDAAAKQTEANKQANAEKRDADYKVALEKCVALAGLAKDACVGNAKVQYGKS